MTKRISTIKIFELPQKWNNFKNFGKRAKQELGIAELRIARLANHCKAFPCALVAALQVIIYWPSRMRIH